MSEESLRAELVRVHESYGKAIKEKIQEIHDVKFQLQGIINAYDQMSMGIGGPGRTFVMFDDAALLFAIIAARSYLSSHPLVKETSGTRRGPGEDQATWAELQTLLWSTDLQLPPSFDRWMRDKISDLDDTIEEIARFNVGGNPRTLGELSL